MVKEERTGFWITVWKRYRRSKLGLASLTLITIFVITAAGASIIANDKPIIMSSGGKLYFPIFYNHKDLVKVNDFKQYIKLRQAVALMPIVPHSPFTTDVYYRLKPPCINKKFVPYSFIVKKFMESDAKQIEAEYRKPYVVAQALEYIKVIAYIEESRIDEAISEIKSIGGEGITKEPLETITKTHPLGTDELGRDILSRMIHGATISLIVGIFATLISLIIGVILGSLAGYFGDNIARISIIRLILNLGALITVISLASTNFKVFSMSKSVWQMIAVFLLFSAGTIAAFVLVNFIAHFLDKVKAITFKLTLPVDAIISRFIEIVICFPTFFILLAIISMVRPNVIILTLIMGIFGWTGVARLVRAEFLRIKNLDYVHAAKIMGASNISIILKHIMPNAITPVLIYVSFGIAGSILSESSLSFLGFGVVPPTASWGQIMENAMSHLDSAWIYMFPGLAIFLVVLGYNLTGEILRDAIDPKSSL